MEDPLPKTGRQDAEIAAAEWLLDEAPAAEAQRPASPVVAPTSGEGFALEDADSGTHKAPPANAGFALEDGDSGTHEAPPRAEPRVRLAPPRPRAKMTLPAGPAVEQVWSRGAEWGSSLVLLCAWAAGSLGAAYLAVQSEAYGLAGILLVVAALVGAFLCYPILITLERPVRMTPEQAARDYFGSLSHHFPHHRRMWLLLSARGRTSSEFASYEGFKRYWKKRLAQLRDGHAGGFAPLVFQVENFRAEKSAGKTDIEAKFQLRVFVRGQREKGPISSVPLERTFARGPDNMWYLDDGTLSV